jgi:hypothetical protein
LGVFICQLCEMDWKVSRKIGIYGNREGSERRGNVLFKDLRNGDMIVQSIVEDLIGMHKGDKLFFHVLKDGQESTLHGIYQVTDEPFYNDKVRIWESSSWLIYPYRFCFAPHPDYLSLCTFDANIRVSDFYTAIENKAIRSLTTLEREEMGAAHAVKTITEEDGQEIERLLRRDYKFRRQKQPIAFEPLKIDKIPIKTQIKKVGNIEFAVKAIAAYHLGQKNPEFTVMIPACRTGKYDFLIESFLGSTVRRPTDIVCISNEVDTTDREVTIIEAKTETAEKKDLIQALRYREIYRLRNADKGALDSKISVCLLAKSFKQDLIDYVSIRNKVLINQEVILLKYSPTANQTDANFVKIDTTKTPWYSYQHNFPSINPNEVFETTIKDPMAGYRLFNGNSDYEFFLETSERSTNILTLKKFFNKNGKTVLLGKVLINRIDGTCKVGNLTEFLTLIDGEAKQFNGDYMYIEPIIIANSYDSLVADFIAEYNSLEVLSHKQEISAWLKV